MSSDYLDLQRDSQICAVGLEFTEELNNTAADSEVWEYECKLSTPNQAMLCLSLDNVSLSPESVVSKVDFTNFLGAPDKENYLSPDLLL